MRAKPEAASSTEWLDLKRAKSYVCVSERTLREWIHRRVDALPATQVGSKILIKRSSLDRWLEAHPLLPAETVDVQALADEILADLTAVN